MSETFLMAAVVTPLLLLITAGVVAFIAITADNRWLRLARECGELPPR